MNIRKIQRFEVELTRAELNLIETALKDLAVSGPIPNKMIEDMLEDIKSINESGVSEVIHNA